ncbi:MAG: hypothetical protein RL290_609, partial [Actinomycetota bacterium]
SAICLAEGLQEGGRLITIDVNPEQEDNIHRFIEEAGMKNKIQFIVGDAYNIIKTLPYKFDLIFIDADKPNYLKYYNQAMEYLNIGGYVIAATVCFFGVSYGFGSRKYLKDLGISLAFAVIVYFSFTKGLNINLPSGFFKGVLGNG